MKSDRLSYQKSAGVGNDTYSLNNSTATNYNYTGSYDPSSIVTVTDKNPIVPEGRLPAPCNASYVSLACADSVDGIVHEPPHMWLGALLPSNYTLDLLDTHPPPRVPDEFYQVHDLTRSGDFGYLALASTLTPEEAYEDSDIDDGSSLTNGTTFGATSDDVDLGSPMASSSMVASASIAVAAVPDVGDTHMPGLTIHKE